MILYAPLFIGVSVGVTPLGDGMQEGGKQFDSVHPWPDLVGEPNSGRSGNTDAAARYQSQRQVHRASLPSFRR